MKIGLLGAGNIGSTLARRLATAGHDVVVANSRGPETIDPDILTTGARPVPAEDAGAAFGVDGAPPSLPALPPPLPVLPAPSSTFFVPSAFGADGTGMGRLRADLASCSALIE